MNKKLCVLLSILVMFAFLVPGSLLAAECDEGCTPGYWKQEQHAYAWEGYLPNDSFESVFGVSANYLSGLDLLAVLKKGGGGERALGRHAVAALLNAASSGVGYDLEVADVISYVQNAFATGDFEAIKNIFSDYNEEGCPLN
jgi:hypothetical protein